jgi:hypothetical protein
MTYGEGYLGALGHADFDAVAAPKAVELLASEECISVDAGWGHTAFVTASGAIAVAGRPFDFKQTLRNINIRGGFPPIQRLMTSVSALLFPRDVPASQLPFTPAEGEGLPMHVSCSSGSVTGVLTSGGAVYVCGSNGFGEAGVGGAFDLVTDLTRLTGIPPYERVVGLSLGFEHGLAVTDAGGLYAWGRGHRGQLGQGDTERAVAALRVPGPDAGGKWLGPGTEFVAVEAGAGVSAALDSHGRVWVWGRMAGAGTGEVRGDGVLQLDALWPRRLLFPGETGEEDTGGGMEVVEGEGDDAEAVARVMRARVGAAQGRRNVAPTAGATLCRADTLATPVAIGPGRSPLSPPFAVVALSSGHAHLSLLTEDGRLWMTGLRGRGVGFDMSEGALAPSPPLPPELDLAARVPEVYTQVVPCGVHPGPLEGHTVRALRSDLHYSYALTEEGRVFRWGWRGLVTEVAPTEGVRVHDLACGFSHYALLS